MCDRVFMVCGHSVIGKQLFVFGGNKLTWLDVISLLLNRDVVGNPCVRIKIAFGGREG